MWVSVTLPLPSNAHGATLPGHTVHVGALEYSLGMPWKGTLPDRESHKGSLQLVLGKWNVSHWSTIPCQVLANLVGQVREKIIHGFLCHNAVLCVCHDDR